MSTAYRIPVMEKFAWQDPVINILATPPVAPTKGDRYIVDADPTGAWATHTKKIAWYDGTVWKFDTIATGWRVFNKFNSNFYSFLDNAWTNATAMGGLTIAGDVTSDATAVDWDLKDNDASALDFVSATDVSLLNFDTRNGTEVVTVGVNLGVVGDIDFSNDAKVVSLALNTGAAVSFDSTSAIFSIKTTLGSENVTAHKDFIVLGDLTVQGTTTTINTQELLVEDNRITLNNNGLDASMLGAGLEIEGTGDTIKAYFKIGEADDSIWTLKANNANVLTFDIDASETLTIAGSLNVESDSAINQDLTTDASPSFSNLTLNGGIVTITADTTTAFALSDGATNILKIDSTTLAKKVIITGSMVLNVGDITMKSAGTIIDTDANMTLTDHNSVAVTVLQAYTAYEDRAQYDDSLGCIVFPDSVDHIVA